MASSITAPGARSAKRIAVQQLLFAIAVLAAWEVAGRAVGIMWLSQPSDIAQRLIEWAAGDLAKHVATTLAEVCIGLALGIVSGVSAGLLLGRSAAVATILRPIIVALYSVPLIAMAPLLILWFGLDMQPKIVLVTFVVFFLLLFNTFAGVRAIDDDLIASLQLMGSTERESFQKVILPASMVWIISGVKIALPYALAAATTGELLGGSWGLGALLSRAATQFDMTGLYAALVVLMVLGVLIGECAVLLEQSLLRWRKPRTM